MSGKASAKILYMNSVTIGRGMLLASALGSTTILLVACDAFSTNTTSEGQIQIEPRVLRGTELELASASNSTSVSDEKLVEIQAAYRAGYAESELRVAVSGSDAVPYPIYPSAKQYRIGGENGLNIVLFETSDSFEKVDAFYTKYVDSQGFSRLVGMPDYVRYNAVMASGADADDAWSNDRPGIVIHAFGDDTEALQSGANPQAKTNIIVSY